MKCIKALAALASASALALALAACGSDAQTLDESSADAEGANATSIEPSDPTQPASDEEPADEWLVSTFIGADVTDATVTNTDEAQTVAQSLIESMGGDSTTDLILTDAIPTETGTTYYIFRQETGGVLVYGASAKLIVDKDGKVKALVSAILPDAKLPPAGEISISQEQAEQVVKDTLASYGAEDMQIASEYTTQTIIPLEDSEDRYCLAWVVYVQSPSNDGDDQGYLANYVSIDGNFLYNMPVSEPNTTEVINGENTDFDFDAYDQQQVTFDIEEGDKIVQVTVPALLDPQTDKVAFLGDAQRKILCVDYTELTENNQFVSAFEEDGESFNAQDVKVYANFIRIYDFFESMGWKGPNGQGSPALLMVDYRINGEPAENCSYSGHNSGWEAFLFGRAKDYGAATDIIAHEFVHCVTSTTMTTNLYINEPGAINEGMSDILGNIAEMALDGDEGAWIIGENATEGGLRSMSNPNEHTQPGYRWDIYYMPDAPECTSMNDYGGVHGNSSLLNIISYKLDQAGMSVEDQAYFWMNVALALVPTTDYAQMAELLPWVLEQSGYSQYADALNAAIDEAGYVKLEQPAELPAGAGTIEFAYPDAEAIEQGQVRVIFFNEEEGAAGRSDVWAWPVLPDKVVRAILPADDYHVLVMVGADTSVATAKLYTDTGWIDYELGGETDSYENTPIHLDEGVIAELATDGLV